MDLLRLLADDPRATVTELADILGEEENTVRNKKRELEKKKVICGYHTVINWDKTNEDHVDAMIGVSAKPERGKGYDSPLQGKCKNYCRYHGGVWCKIFRRH